MTTLHILSNPNGAVHIDNRTDPFAVAVVKFIDHMTARGWNCIHYGVVGSEVTCENVTCVNVLSADHNANVNEFNRVAGPEIALRKQPGDMIVCFFGVENQGACKFNSDLKTVEPSIGYDTNAVFADHRVFVSYAQMHMFYGAKGMLMTPSWWDAVIPNAITPAEFEYSGEKKDYFLYFGRVIESKGIHLAIQATKAAGKRLIIAGPGNLEGLGYATTPEHVTMAGVCDVNQRRELMRDAQAILGLTYYVEPFGNMIAEAYMSGTPAITTDWGGFVDTVIPGVTGYRCREFRDVVTAIENIHTISPAACKEWAMSQYTDDVVHDQLHEYFVKISQKDFYRP